MCPGCLFRHSVLLEPCCFGNCCPNQCGRTHVSTARQEVADIFVCGNTALGCSIYLCHQSGDHPWSEARTLG